MSKKLQIVGGLNIPQADFNQTDEKQLDYIKNKPTINGVELVGNLTTEDIRDANTNIIYNAGYTVSLTELWGSPAVIADDLPSVLRKGDFIVIGQVGKDYLYIISNEATTGGVKYFQLKQFSYNNFADKPSINNVVLEGSLTSRGLKLNTPSGTYETYNSLSLDNLSTEPKNIKLSDTPEIYRVLQLGDILVDGKGTHARVTSIGQGEINVGDNVVTFYFDTSITPDFAKFDWSNAQVIEDESSPYAGMEYITLIKYMYGEWHSLDAIRHIYEGNDYYNYALIFDKDQWIYNDVLAEWSTNQVGVGTTGGITIHEIYQHDAWKDYIFKSPEGTTIEYKIISSGSNSNSSGTYVAGKELVKEGTSSIPISNILMHDKTLQVGDILIDTKGTNAQVRGVNQRTGESINPGDTFNTMYFDTSVTPNFDEFDWSSAEVYNGEEGNLLNGMEFIKLFTFTQWDSESSFDAFRGTYEGNPFYALVHAKDGVMYVSVQGWVETEHTYDEPMVVSEVYQQDIWMKYIFKTPSGEFVDYEVISNNQIPQEIYDSIEEARQIAEGRARSKSYDTLQDLVQQLNSTPITEFKVADNIYVYQTDVPDYWVGQVNSTLVEYTYVDDATTIEYIKSKGQIGYYVLGILESEKVEYSANYNDLENIPQINGVKLSGNKTSADLKLGEVTSGGGFKGGMGASATSGGAIGYSAVSYNGFAGGDNSFAAVSGGVAVGADAKALVDNAIQLGTGTNSNEGTLQVRDYQLLDENGKIPSERLSNTSNPNLLINSDFSVNQNRNIEYENTGKSSIYCVDRWTIDIGVKAAKSAINSAGIVVSKEATDIAGYYLLRQSIEDYAKLSGKTLTVTVSYKNNTGGFRIQCNDGISYNSSAFTETSGIATFTFTVSSAPTQLSVRIQDQTSSAMSIEIEWVKLEIGAVSTAYIPPKYEEEIWKCNAIYGERLPISNPNIVINSNFAINQRGQIRYPNTEISVDCWGKYSNSIVEPVSNGVRFTSTVSSTSSTQFTQLYQLFNIPKDLLVNKTVTLSCSVNDIIYTKTVDLIEEMSYSSALHDVHIPGMGAATIRWSTSSKTFYVAFFDQTSYNPNHNPNIINWVKVEFGSVATPYVIPTLSEELVKCRNNERNNYYSSESNNDNILVNSNFYINQRGQTNYTTHGQYTVDRWILVYGSLTINGDGTVTHNVGSTTWQGLRQFIERPSRLAGKTVTLSARGYSTTSKRMISINVRKQGETDSTQLGYIEAPISETFTTSSVTISIPTDITDGDSLFVTLFTINANATATWQWVKLEEGSIATPYSVPSYEKELLKCQSLSTDPVQLLRSNSGAFTSLAVGQPIEKIVFNPNVSVEKMTNYLSSLTYDEPIQGVNSVCELLGIDTEADTIKVYAIDFGALNVVVPNTSGYGIAVIDTTADSGGFVLKQAVFATEYNEANVTLINAIKDPSYVLNYTKAGWSDTNDYVLDTSTTHTIYSVHDNKVSAFIGRDSRFFEVVEMLNKGTELNQYSKTIITDTSDNIALLVNILNNAHSIKALWVGPSSSLTLNKWTSTTAVGTAVFTRFATGYDISTSSAVTTIEVYSCTNLLSVSSRYTKTVISLDGAISGETNTDAFKVQVTYYNDAEITA